MNRREQREQRGSGKGTKAAELGKCRPAEKFGLAVQMRYNGGFVNVAGGTGSAKSTFWGRENHARERRKPGQKGAKETKVWDADGVERSGS